MTFQINPDAFLSQAKSTVLSNGEKVAFRLNMSGFVALMVPYEADSSLPEFDHCEYYAEVAIKMLILSRRPGKYSDTYIQFDTIRNLYGQLSPTTAEPQKGLIESPRFREQ
jgi:hypothetical protein